MSLLDIIIKFFKSLFETKEKEIELTPHTVVSENGTIHAPISETTHEQRSAMYEHNLGIISVDPIYTDGRYDKMVKIYRSRLDKTKKWDANLARDVAIEVLGNDVYHSLTQFDQGALITNIEHGKVDTA